MHIADRNWKRSLFRAKWSTKCFYHTLQILTSPLVMIPVKRGGTRRSMSALTPGFPLPLVFFFFSSSKQLDVFVYHIRNCGCQCDSATRWLLLDLFATFQVILECEIYLSLRALVSHSTVIIQCVSEVNRPALSDNSILCAASPPQPLHFVSHISVSQVEGEGDEEVLSCVGGRSFRSVRERWWYIALSKCGVSAGLPTPA